MYPLLENESERLAVLRDLKVLDTPDETHFDAVCRTAQALFSAPIAFVSLVDKNRQWFKARCGIDVKETPRNIAFCNYAILSDDALIIEDALADPRFAENPLVTGPLGIRFYAGAPLILHQGIRVGTLCLMDSQRRSFSPEQVRQFQDLANIVVAHLRLHEARNQIGRDLEALQSAQAKLREAADYQLLVEQVGGIGYWQYNLKSGKATWSPSMGRLVGQDVSDGELTLDDLLHVLHPDEHRDMFAAFDPRNAGGNGMVLRPFDRQRRLVRADGTVRTVISRGLPQHDETGAVVALLGVCVDITDLVRSEEQLRGVSTLLRVTLENMDQGILMVGADNRVLVHNQKARDLLGVSEGLLHEGARFDLLQQHQIDRGEFRKVDGELRHLLESAALGTAAVTYERERPNGTSIEVRSVPLPTGGLVRTFTDITERRRREAALRLAEAEYQTLFQNAVVGVYRANLDGTLVRANQALAKLHGYGDSACATAPGTGFTHDWYVDGDRTHAFMRLLLTHGRVDDFVSEVTGHATGRPIWVSETAWLVRDAEGCPSCFEGTVVDATERKRAEAQIEHMARHDALTGLPNRRQFQERLTQELVHAQRQGTAVAVLCCDLDRFKTVNDTFGHPAGDALLCTLADRMRRSLQPGDIVARLGGDEFAIILLGRSHPHGVGAAAQRLIEIVGEPVDIDGHLTNVGVSIGVAIGLDDGDRADLLFKNADIALYRAKEAGRHTCRFYEAGMDMAVASRNLLEIDLKDTVRNGGFALHYQPIIDLASDTLRGFEALLRWPHAAKGMISPADFIPLAEETGLIVELGAWALRDACQEAASWPSDLRVGVNVSAVQIQHIDFHQHVLDALVRSGLAPERLELEITESVLVKDAERVIACLHRLRRIGVRLAIDDFGTGYSSLSYLCQFPFDKIKIDRSFIQDACASTSGAIVRAVVGLGRHLGATITAEGVETQAQLDWVRREGCSEVQGFIFGKPMPPSVIKGMMRPVGVGHDQQPERTHCPVSCERRSLLDA
ncbi:bifunctional diguanylate cyclase/phosphodiesterase [Methylobacterium sp. Leaf113]|uniref:bifunctional diguanylate cyclase/phosphodiesterase n=1 Tax=Methylobacterium sp. Leaf113 TaxID=1736259 RepID=UPI0009EA1410|nr:EAL domain-containing protein [Methylobacterium sp. Leaf113]